MAAPADVTITDEPSARRYTISTGGASAGEIVYRFVDGRRVITHTGVEPAFEGKGIAGVATQLLLDRSRELGERVVPLCPYTATYIERHEQYGDLIDHELYRSLRGG